jgi:hypothetical protein
MDLFQSVIVVCWQHPNAPCLQQAQLALAAALGQPAGYQNCDTCGHALLNMCALAFVSLSVPPLRFRQPLPEYDGLFVLQEACPFVVPRAASLGCRCGSKSAVVLGWICSSCTLQRLRLVSQLELPCFLTIVDLHRICQWRCRP